MKKQDNYQLTIEEKLSLLSKKEQAVFREAQKNGILVYPTRAYATQVYNLFYEWCEEQHVPFIQVATTPKFGKIHLDLITTPVDANSPAITGLYRSMRESYTRICTTIKHPERCVIGYVTITGRIPLDHSLELANAFLAAYQLHILGKRPPYTRYTVTPGQSRGNPVWAGDALAYLQSVGDIQACPAPGEHRPSWFYHQRTRQFLCDDCLAIG